MNQLSDIIAAAYAIESDSLRLLIRELERILIERESGREAVCSHQEIDLHEEAHHTHPQ